VSRAAIHIALGAFALFLRWLAPWQASVCALAALLFNLLLLHRVTRGSLLRGEEKRRGFSWGIALYPAMVLAAVAVFHSRLEFAAAVWGLLAFGDGMAALCGMLIGGPRLAWNREKSWAGLAAFVICGTAASAFLIRWTQRAQAVWIGGSFAEPAHLLVACLTAALVAAFVESMATDVDDNLLVPLAGGGVLYAASLVEPWRLAAACALLKSNLLFGSVINTALAVAAFALRGVDLSGAVWGALLGTALFVFSGWRGLVSLAFLFILVTAATRIGHDRKSAMGIAQEREGRRGARNVMANISIGLTFAFLAQATVHTAACTVAMTAAFATAACDTVSSEIGKAFGRRHYLVTTFRRVQPGTSGAVTLAGTLSGLIAAALMAATAWVTGLIGGFGVAAVTAAAFTAALLESFMRATSLVWRPDGASMANLANTLAGGLLAMVIYALWLRG
jgi:uncharacterized protein (TIGR00297 family)